VDAGFIVAVPDPENTTLRPFQVLIPDVVKKAPAPDNVTVAVFAVTVMPLAAVFQLTPDAVKAILDDPSVKVRVLLLLEENTPAVTEKLPVFQVPWVRVSVPDPQLIASAWVQVMPDPEILNPPAIVFPAEVMVPVATMAKARDAPAVMVEARVMFPLTVMEPPVRVPV
jgi:hypothetical protein